MLKTCTTIENPMKLLLLIIITTIYLHLSPSTSQQPYLNNNQLDCTDTTTTNLTKGFTCNHTTPASCSSYLTFRSNPRYNSPPTIAYLLNSTPSTIARLNHISDVDPIPPNRLVVVPVPCSCSRQQYYQHNANYTLNGLGETYLSMANNTYQGLTTCQAVMTQNLFKANDLRVGETFLVPLRCACPTKRQKKNFGAKFLLSYIVTWGDSVSSIAKMFNVTEQSILDANVLQQNEVIYPFTPILVPLKSEPSHIRLPLPNSIPVGPVGTGNKIVTRSSKKGVYIGVGVGVGVLVIAMLSLVAWFCLIRPSTKKDVEKEEKGDQKKELESVQYASLPRSCSTNSQTTKSSSVDINRFKHATGSLTAYKFEEIEKATEFFSEGHRIKGSVFRAEFDGDEAAVKILKGNVTNEEMNILKRISHSNINRLSGYCMHEGNTYLIYEYAEKGSIDDWLFQRKNLQSEDDSCSHPVLSWKQRVRIACNIADALNYLHNYISPPYIHKNLKSSNILLDSTYKAKITNFGVTRTILDEDENRVVHLTKHVVGTHGYLAPEYIKNRQVTPKLDVFAFGVVVLELLSGKPTGTNKGDTENDPLYIVISKVFQGINVREELTEFMDSNLHKKYPLDMAYSLAQLAHKCVDRDMKSRPSMADISMTLSKIYSSSLDWDPFNELGSSSSRTHNINR